MPASFQIDKERRLVISTASGIFTIADALAHQQDLPKHPDFDPSFSHFVDLSEVTKPELSGKDMEWFAQATIFSPHSRRAVLATHDVAFGLARMYGILREFQGEEGLQVFRNRDQAMNWVLAKDSAA
jgi:hypothetical protein